MLEFSEIYAEQLPRVYGYIAYRVGNRTDAEDLTQQTFERALGHWSQFDARRATITTWLLAIARNLVIDHHRAATRRSAAVELSSCELVSGNHDAAGPETSAELDQALAALGDRERELIALRYGADLSGPQIASLVGLSLANVQQILSRALRKLRASLDASTDDAGD
jgi:RNA polymerase sigma-70 factor (ECF subfamily)